MVLTHFVQSLRVEYYLRTGNVVINRDRTNDKILSHTLQTPEDIAFFIDWYFRYYGVDFCFCFLEVMFLSSASEMMKSCLGVDYTKFKFCNQPFHKFYYTHIEKDKIRYTEEVVDRLNSLRG